MTDPALPLRVIVVGAGFSGTLVAIHLLRQNACAGIDLIDPRIPGRGLAYSTVWDQHLLNVPAIRMSAFGAEPMHFLEWLQAHGMPHAEAGTFAPRKLYGTYVQSVLEASVRNSKCRFRHHFAQAERVSFDGVTARVTLDSGEEIRGSKVVLACGNPAPRAIAARLPGYFGSPWEPGACADFDAGADILLVGTGLTAVDAFLSLRAQGHRGNVHLVSRRGKLPHAHLPYHPLAERFRPAGAMGARLLVRAIRRRVKAAEASGDDWRAVIDSLRPATNDIWSELEFGEQKRALRHLKTWWDIHRHRMAPEIGAQVSKAQERGEFLVYAGRLRAVHAEQGGLLAEIALRNGDQIRLAVQRVINCTGSDEDYRNTSNTALRSLLTSGHIEPHAIGKGLNAGAQGALLNSAGEASDWLFTLGPPRLGGLFETTAVPELRKQAEALAGFLSSIVLEPVEISPALFIAAGI